jgi:hypothetical protein
MLEVRTVNVAQPRFDVAVQQQAPESGRDSLAIKSEIEQE